MKEKICSRCKTTFSCGSAETGASCWCNALPPIFQPDPIVDCFCKDCLFEETKKRIESFVATITPQQATTLDLAKYKTKVSLEGIDYYIENGLYVFTKWHHLKRGECCKSGCRHCPYGFKKKAV